MIIFDKQRREEKKAKFPLIARLSLTVGWSGLPSADRRDCRGCES